jgi:hypothetical protein
MDIEDLEEEPQVVEAKDFRIRTKPPYPTPPEDLARIYTKRDTLEDKRLALQAKVRPHEVTVPGHEVPPESVIKTTKAGLWSTGSAWGKIASILDELEVPYKVGESQYFSGDVVKAIKGKVEGKQTAQTVDYQLIEGEVKTHHWLDFPWEGYRATLRGTEVFYRGAAYPYKEWIDRMIGGSDG